MIWKKKIVKRQKYHDKIKSRLKGGGGRRKPPKYVSGDDVELMVSGELQIWWSTVDGVAGLRGVPVQCRVAEVVRVAIERVTTRYRRLEDGSAKDLCFTGNIARFCRAPQVCHHR